MTETQTVERAKLFLNKFGNATGAEVTLNDKPLGLGDLVEQLVRAILAEQSGAAPTTLSDQGSMGSAGESR